MIKHRQIHRISVFVAVILTVLFFFSFALFIQVCPWVGFLHGQVLFSSNGLGMNDDWLAAWLPDYMLSWQGKMAPIFGTREWWFMHHDGSAVYVCYAPLINPSMPIAGPPFKYLYTFPLSYFLIMLYGLAWWTRARRARHGYCVCGYDLTGNTSGTCPECGADVSQGAAHEA